MYLNNLNDLKIAISPSSLPINKPLSCINYQDLKDGMLDMINSNNDTLPSIVEDFNQQDPLNAPIVVGEVVVGHIIGLIPVAGGVLSKITSALFGMINKNMKDDSLAEQIIAHVSQIIDAEITQNNIKIIKLSIEGITSVYQLFSDSLNNYLEPKVYYSNKQQQDLRDQVLNRFDDVIAAIIAQQPLILNLAQSAGLPFYCHSCALFVAAHSDILTNKKALDLKDDYFTSNLKTLRDNIDKFNTNIHKAIYQQTSLIFKDDYTKCNTFLSGIYTSGLSFYQSWIKRSFEIEFSTPLTRWNSLELYGKDYNFDYQKSYYQMYLDMGRDMLQRTSMLQSIEIYSHIDAVIRIKQNYLTTEKQPNHIQYEGYYGVTGDSQDVLKTEIFFQADSNKSYLSPTQFLPSVRYISDTPWGALKYMVLDDVNNQSFSIGQGNRENKSYFNLPGYCFNGLNLYMSRHNGKQCHDDSGAWLTESGPIFRFYDGYGAMSLEMENNLPIKQKSYELDLNHGFDPQLSNAQFAYVDMLVGKNCILLHQDAVFCLPSDGIIGKSSTPQPLIILLQCANESEQLLSLSIRTGNASKGTLVASGDFSLGQNQDNIIYKLTPLINHPISNNKTYFRTYQLALTYTLTGSQESNLYLHLHFSKPDTLLADITLLF